MLDLMAVKMLVNYTVHICEFVTEHSMSGLLAALLHFVIKLS